MAPSFEVGCGNATYDFNLLRRKRYPPQPKIPAAGSTPYVLQIHGDCAWKNSRDA